ncbi:RagB/SusD family nutrient uptake outer membrane protein [Aquiflexum sp.]|uniref:RagB/SusD family nutrient uptake outer membrane protein n=1 Tax=Aquiflexum sp. TaxID=1872584 RepID=UPI0035935ABF
MKIIIYNMLKSLGLAIVIAFPLVSCEGILKVDPRQSIAGFDALSTPENMEAALNSPYARLRAVSAYGRNLTSFGDALADNGLATNNSGRLFNETRNQPYSHYAHWTNFYFGINELNLFLEAIPGVQGTPAVPASTKSRWEGEAKFLRALFYFDLVKAYAYLPGVTVPELDKGGIPLVLEGVRTSDIEKALNRQTARSSVEQVYAQIYKDLEDAIRLLNDNRGIQFASQSAAKALLSRVALYNQDWVKAADLSNEALASSRGKLLEGDDYIAGWRLSVHPESIFDLRFENASESNGANESIQATYTTIRNLENTTQVGGWGDLIPTPAFVNLMGISVTGTGPNLVIADRGKDVRAFQFEVGPGRVANGSGRRMECIKFASKSGFAFGDNIPVIRKSEMLLNRMEAYFHLGQEDLALEDLNFLKKARGVEEVDLSGEDLLSEILLERRKELAFEGHRFLDLKRYGKDIIKQQGNVPFSDFRILANIPQAEVDGNKNLEQNAGY